MRKAMTRKSARHYLRVAPVVAAVAVGAMLSQGTVTSAEASPYQQAEQAKQAVLDEVRAAAASHRMEQSDPEKESGEPAAEARLLPEQPETLSAEAPAVEAAFSGHAVTEPLDLTLAELPEEVAVSAESQTAGVAVTAPVEITATTADGGEVTQFPAEATNTRGDGGDIGDGPTVSDVTPGVLLNIAVDPALVKEAKLDPGSLRVYTREGNGDAWTELASFYDAETKTVTAESTHLSQFVVIGIPFPVPPGPSIVLDPDNDEGVVSTPSPASEFGYNWQLATSLKGMLEERCLATVTLTRPGPDPMVSRDTRAGVAAAANPVATLGIGFNTWQGDAWGNPDDGGTHIYSRGGGLDQALTGSLIGNMPAYTGRPAKEMPSNGAFPFPEFGGLPGAYTHMEALFMDHIYDWQVINQGGFDDIVNGAFTGMGKYLESQGYDCTDPVTGGWPAPPSQAEKDRWRHLGDQMYQTYGADPVSFSTGNLFEDEPLFTLPGLGGQETDLTLFYNSQDGRLSRVGAGWTFGLGFRAQRFDDGSVMTVRGDGASYVFNPDGAGGYTDVDDTGMTLSEAGLGQLKLAATTGEEWLFDAADIDGIGELIKHTDAEGHATTLGYGPASYKTHQFVPLTSITDAAGQTITVGSDAVGRLTSFTHPDGRVWGLVYDGAGNLATITNPDGRTRTFTYDGSHQMLTATDAAGITYLRNEYDGQGRVAKQWDADQNLRTFDYSAPGKTVYTDNEGTKTTFAYDGVARITGITDATGHTATYQYGDRNQVSGYTDEAGRKTFYEYDDNGNVTKETRPDGSVISYTYTPGGQLASKTDLDGERTTTYEVNAQGLVTATQQPDGTIIKYEYTPAGDLAQVIQPSGATTNYTYDSRGNVTSVIDPNGNPITYTYDAANRVTSVTDPNGGVTVLEWDAGDRLMTTTNAAGGVTTYGYDANDHVTTRTDPDGATTAFAWDALFRMVAVTAPDGGVTEYEYNTEDELTKTTDPVGAATSFVLDELYRPVTTLDPNGGQWERKYDEVGNILEQVDPLDATTKTEIDALDQVVKTEGPTGITGGIEYDAAGRVTGTSDKAGNTTRYEYDLLDRLVKTTDQQGEVTEYVYDIDGNLIGVIDRQGNPTHLAVDPGGRVTSVTDATGAVTEFAYDRNGNVTSVIDPNGNATSTGYDALDRAVTVTDPLGAVTTYAYDPMGRVTTVTDPNGNTKTTTYDPAGRVATITDAAGGTTTYRYNQAGQQTGTIDPNGNETRYEYDPAGQLAKVTEAYEAGADSDSETNVTTRYEYTAAGNLSFIVDPNGNETRFEYDAASQLVKEIAAYGATTSYSYDELGQLDRRIDGNGATVNFDYTARGDVAAQSWPGTNITFEYDAEQRLIAMTDPFGASGWTYDQVGRPLTQIDVNGKHLGYGYDPAGQLTQMTTPAGDEIGYSYDAAGRATAQTTPWGDIGYEWDPAGNLTAQSRSNGVDTSYGYDPDNRVTSITHQTPVPATPPTPVVSPVPVQPLSQTAKECALTSGYLEDRALPNLEGEDQDCVKTWDYQARRTLPGPALPAAAGDKLRYDYEYDLAGNVTNATSTLGAPDTGATPDEEQPAPGTVPVATPEPAPAVTWPAGRDNTIPNPLAREFSYDRLNRLAGSVASTGETNRYQYDPAGNRTNWERQDSPTGDFAVTAHYNSVNQLTDTNTTGTRAGSTSYTYDGAGNRAGQNQNGVATSYTHDPSGRMTGLSTDERTATYGYDGLGRQSLATNTNKYGTQTTTQTWDGLDVVEQDNSAHGVTTLTRDVLGQLELQAGGGTDDTRWALLDRLGSSVGQTDTTGQITQLADYSDFGVQDLETTGWNAALGYTGETGDIAAGLNQYYARSYEPGTGTWTAPDTWRGLLAQPQSLHRYAYVQNNPATWADVNGFRIGDPSAYNTSNKHQRERMKVADRAENQRAVNAYEAARGLPPSKAPNGKGCGKHDPCSKIPPKERHKPPQFSGGHGMRLRQPTGTGGGINCAVYQIPDQVIGCLLSGADRQVQSGIRDIQKWIRDVAASEGGQATADWMSGLAAFANTVGLVLDASGIGLPAGFSLAAVALVLNYNAMLIYCTADPKGTDCLFAMDSGPNTGHLEKKPGKHEQ